jgi:hypothetical protein
MQSKRDIQNLTGGLHINTHQLYPEENKEVSQRLEDRPRENEKFKVHESSGRIFFTIDKLNGNIDVINKYYLDSDGERIENRGNKNSRYEKLKENSSEEGNGPNAAHDNVAEYVAPEKHDSMAVASAVSDSQI